MRFAHPSSISSIEHGRRPIYREELPVLAAALECTVDDLLPDTGDSSSRYPVARGKQLIPLVAMVIVVNLVAGHVSAEEHAGSNQQFSGQGPVQDSAPMPEAVNQGHMETAQPPRPLFWGDNCDHTVPLPPDNIGS